MLGALAAHLFIGMDTAIFVLRRRRGRICCQRLSVLQLRHAHDDWLRNLVPDNNPGQGQSLAVPEALLGQLFLAAAVAKIVTAWAPKVWVNTT